METIKLTIGQPRVANPFGSDTATYLAIKDDNDVVRIVPESYASEWPSDYGYEAVAKAIVTRPAIMCGSLEEIQADICCLVGEELVAKDICVENECGVLFAK